MHCQNQLLLVRCGIMNRPIVNQSPLVNPTLLPLHPISAIATDTVLVVAPHPDDETLGCGGAIALLRSLGCNVQVLVISDGTLSHPRSRKYPPAALRALREAETLAATTVLGVDVSDVTFLQLPDGAIPTLDPEFKDAVNKCCINITKSAAKTIPKTIFLPQRSDPHPDHRATWQLIHAALKQLQISPRLIEYPIWDWDPEQRRLSQSDRITAWRLDISQVVELKQQAIAAYRSQTTNLIDDDPEGFRLTSQMLANFTRPWEVYLEEEKS